MEALESVLESVNVKGTIYACSEMTDTYEQVLPVVVKFVSYMGGSLEDAKDIFHDALVIYFEVISQNRVKIHTSEEAYILGISKHLWIRMHNRDSNKIPMSDTENKISIPYDYYPTINDKRLLKFLKLTGKKCMDLLHAFYFEQLPMKKLMKNLGYLNEHSASVQKYKCLEKIRNIVKEKSLTYDDFTE